MKLKYYLRGMGIGIILTAIVMGFALGGRKATLSDAQIIQRAKALGMVEGNTGVLSQTADEVNESNENDTSSSDTSLDQEGKEISEEVQQEVALSDPSVPEVVKEEEVGEEDSSEAVSSVATQEISTESSTTENSSESASESSKKVSEASNETSVEEIKEDTSASEAASSVASDNSTEASAATPAATGTSKVITIPGGLGSDQVASILYREGLVDNAVSFNKYLIDRGLDRIIRSGTKTIPGGATYEEIANIITKG